MIRPRSLMKRPLSYTPLCRSGRSLRRTRYPNCNGYSPIPNFASSLAFTDAVGALAEEQGHHPRIVTEWGRVTVTWWTHKIRNLHRNDFVMAAKTDQLYQPE